MRFKSIFARIIFLQAIALLFASVVLPSALYWLMRSAANDLHGLAMLDQADVLSSHIELAADGSLTIDLPASLLDLYSESYGRYAYAVMDETGHVLFSSLKNGSPIFTANPRSFETVFLTARQGSKAISGVELPREISGRRIWVQVGEDLAHRDVLIDDLVTQFFERVAWITLPILILLLAANIMIFRKVLRPLRQASEQAQTISPLHTDVRLPVDTMPNEVRKLVEAVNGALERLEKGLRLEQEFAADAAHELRTPLTVLHTRLDTLGDPRITGALREDVERMCRIVGQLLDLAESDAFVVMPSDEADLGSVCMQVVKSVAPLVIAQHKEICLDAGDERVWVKGNPDMLCRAVRNLVDNAIRHTPEGTTVQLIVRSDGTVTVLDQGPGIDESEREFLFRRFWRRDRRGSGCAGLGLSIVRRIADAHMASIVVENRPSGGASFSLMFPA